MSESSMHLLAAAADMDEGATASAPSTRSSKRQADSEKKKAEQRNPKKAARSLPMVRAGGKEASETDEAKHLNVAGAGTSNESTTETENPSTDAKIPGVTKGKKNKREERIEAQNRLAAEERERKRKQQEERVAMKKLEAEKLEETRKAKKQRQEELKAEKLEEAVAVAGPAKVEGIGHTEPTETTLVVASQPAESDGNIVATDLDVLLGRGGLTNQHTGNKRFRTIVLEYQPEYLGLRSRAKKSRISKSIVERINNSGGRFLKEVDGVWTEVSFDVAAKKASQALRENAKELKQLFNVQAGADGGQAKEEGGSKESS
jgi:hypothetical protein